MHAGAPPREAQAGTQSVKLLLLLVVSRKHAEAEEDEKPEGHVKGLWLWGCRLMPEGLRGSTGGSRVEARDGAIPRAEAEACA